MLALRSNNKLVNLRMLEFWAREEPKKTEESVKRVRSSSTSLSGSIDVDGDEDEDEEDEGKEKLDHATRRTRQRQQLQRPRLLPSSTSDESDDSFHEHLLKVTTKPLHSDESFFSSDQFHGIAPHESIEGRYESQVPTIVKSNDATQSNRYFYEEDEGIELEFVCHPKTFPKDRGRFVGEPLVPKTTQSAATAREELLEELVKLQCQQREFGYNCGEQGVLQSLDQSTDDESRKELNVLRQPDGSDRVANRGEAAKVLQLAVRRYLFIRKLSRKRQERNIIAQRHEAASKCQTAIVRYLVLLRTKRKHDFAARQIQTVWRKYGYAGGRQLAGAAAAGPEDASTLIQSKWRSCRQQSEYRRLRRFIITIQAVIRIHLARRKESFHLQKYEYGRDKPPLVAIQALVRMFLVRRRNERAEKRRMELRKRWLLRKQYQLHCHHAVTIQSLVRKFLVCRWTRLSEKSASTLQSKWRSHWQRMKYKRLKAGTVVAQSAVRVYLARRQETTMLRELNVPHSPCIATPHNDVASERAAIVIQSEWRSYQQEQDLWSSKICVGRRASMRRLKPRSHKQISEYHVVMARLWNKSEEKTEERASRMIQACWRSKRQHSKYKSMMRTIIAIQTLARVHIGRKNEFVTVIQALVRGYLVRVCNQGAEKAVLVLQSRWRCYKEKCKYRRTMLHVITIQDFSRSVMARNQRKLAKKAADCETKKSKVTVIQALSRGYLVRLQNHRARCQQANSSRRMETQVIILHTVLLCLALFHEPLSRCKLELSREERAVKVLQARWRLRKHYVKYRQCRSCVVTIQAIVRGYLAREMAKEAGRMQRKRRQLLMKFEVEKSDTGADENANGLMSTCSCRPGAELIETNCSSCEDSLELLCKSSHAALIQAVVRGFLVRRDVCCLSAYACTYKSLMNQYIELFKMQRADYAAVTLQSNWRCLIYKRKHQQVKGSAIMIQTTFREYLARRLASDVRTSDDMYCLTIPQVEATEEAAKVIQAKWRSYDEKSSYLVVSLHAIRVQARIRGFLVRSNLCALIESAKRYQLLMIEYIRECKIQREYQASVIIQAKWRRYRSENMYNAKKRLVVVIQAQIRGHLIRRNYCGENTNDVLYAVQGNLIQGGWRPSCEYKNLSTSAVRIQSLTRGYFTRRSICNLAEYTHAIQSLMRDCINESKTEQLGEVSILLQAKWRCYRYSMRYQRLKRGAIHVQAVTRGYLVRRSFFLLYTYVCSYKELMGRYINECKFERDNHASIVLQAHFRGYITRRRMASENDSSIDSKESVLTIVDYKMYEDEGSEFTAFSFQVCRDTMSLVSTLSHTELDDYSIFGESASFETVTETIEDDGWRFLKTDDSVSLVTFITFEDEGANSDCHSIWSSYSNENKGSWNPKDYSEEFDSKLSSLDFGAGLDEDRQGESYRPTEGQMVAEKKVCSGANLPSHDAMYDAVSISFLAQTISIEEVAKVYDEAMRILRPGGHIFVLDFDGMTVEKLPKLRHLLSRVQDKDDALYDARTFQVLQQNVMTARFHRDDPRIIRWIGEKPRE